MGGVEKEFTTEISPLRAGRKERAPIAEHTESFESVWKLISRLEPGDESPGSSPASRLKTAANLIFEPEGVVSSPL